MLTAHVGQVQERGIWGGASRERERETQGADLFSHSPIHKRELHFESKELGF